MLCVFFTLPTDKGDFFQSRIQVGLALTSDFRQSLFPDSCEGRKCRSGTDTARGLSCSLGTPGVLSEVIPGLPMSPMGWGVTTAGLGGQQDEQGVPYPVVGFVRSNTTKPLMSSGTPGWLLLTPLVFTVSSP